ncbi:histidine kinase [Nocardioides sp. LHD-245]|uniref:sensor histidine kinase n=1 Tax=Nocardioides sp. LHD-245 TaxID=3051387 RepID=UPI0027DED737|nr:histidine kinase [Nocardioides sp. LHD-245]
MFSALLKSHDRPVPASYLVAAVAASVVVGICFVTARWTPWFLEDWGIGYGAYGVISVAALSFIGLGLAVVQVPACWLAFRWPVFAIGLACAPLLVTLLDPSRAPLHFGVVANLAAVGLTSAWRRPRLALLAVGIAYAAILVWLRGGGDMAAPFRASIELRYTEPLQIGIVYTVAFVLLLAFVLWFRSSALREAQRARLVAHEGAVTEQGAVVAERARLARDLHDVVAHHVSLIAVRAETAPYTEPDLDPAGRRVLAEVAAEARLALDELRGVLGILGRAGDAERAPQPTLADIAALVERTRRSGQEVRLAGDLQAPAGAAAGYAAYRVVQEALTNARKHAPGAPVDIEVTATSHLIEVRVSNPVTQPATRLGSGRGLVGMRERVDALGGRLRIQAAGQVFEVEATIPTGGAA